MNESVDYKKILDFVRREVAKIPPPKPGKDAIVDYNFIVKTVQKLIKIPKDADPVDYKKIKEYIEKSVEELRYGYKTLNSGGPTTRLGEIVDVNIDNAVSGDILKFDGRNWISGEEATGSVTSVNGNTGAVVLDTSDIAATTDKNYVTDAQLTVLGNTSGTNTGDQTSIVGITGTIAEFNAALSDGSFATGGGTATGTNTGDQDLSSYVTKTGTPANNYIAVWTADGIIEGTNSFTYDGDAFSVKNSAGASMLLVYGAGLSSDAGLQYYGDTALNFYAAGTSSNYDINLIPKGTGKVSVGTSVKFVAGNIELGHASDTTITRSAAGVIAVEGVVIPSISSTNTLTNKRITKREQTVTDTATLTITSDSVDIVTVTALAQAMTIAAPTGTPTQGQSLMIRIKDNGTARALTWNAIFRASTDLPLPTTTVISKTLYVGFIYNSEDSKWDLLAKLNNF